VQALGVYLVRTDKAEWVESSIAGNLRGELSETTKRLIKVVCRGLLSRAKRS
jgi:hypothetical protein